MQRQFATTGSINREKRRTIETTLRFVNSQGLAVGPESLQKLFVLFSSEPDGPHLSYHHGPAENRGDKEHREN
jgi:hypothetical protein